VAAATSAWFQLDPIPATPNHSCHPERTEGPAFPTTHLSRPRLTLRNTNS